MNLRVSLGPRSYDIVITADDRAGLGAFARQRCSGTQAFLVTDENVAVHARSAAEALSAAGFGTTVIVLPPGEAQKSLERAAFLYDRLAELPADRKTLVVAVGGGVVGDLAGFAAATYARGLSLLMVPTSLLAMVDSAVGGKVGVNHPRGKNLIGAFHQPVGVWIDLATLQTLPDREYRSALAEVVKYGVSLDAELFVYLEKHVEELLSRETQAVGHIVARCCRLKADIVERDEREETGLRALLNYGHTFGHAFEALTGHDGSWLHGEAVSVGMVCAARLAERRGLIPADVVRRQQTLLEKFGLPAKPPPYSLDKLLSIMHNDKKARAGQLCFVLPLRLGEATLFDNVSEAEVRTVGSEQ